MELIIVIGIIAGMVTISRQNARISTLEEKLYQLEARQIHTPQPDTAPSKSPLPPRQYEPPQKSTQYWFQPDPLAPAVEARAETPDHVQESEVIAEPPTPYPAETYSPAIEKFELPEWVSKSLTGGRLFVTLGIVLLFMGAAMLFKYMSQFVIIPISLRFIGVAIVALAMIGLGYYQKDKRRDYGLYLQGGGLGLLFITVFSAFKLYALLSSSVALGLLVVIGGATFALSVVNNAMALSVLAVVGGFAAPILTSTGGGSHIALFTYYLVINCVIFCIAWKKSWRLLNAIGFIFTFAIGVAWGGKYYTPEFYASVQAFLIIYFLLYIGIGLLYAWRSKLNLTYPIEASAIFAVPLTGCGLQFSLVHSMPNGEAISSFVLGAFYAGLFWLLRKHQNEGLRELSKPFLWLSILFSSLTIPFAFNHYNTAMLFSVEGLTLVYVAGKTRERFYGIAGSVVLLASNLFLLAAYNLANPAETPFFNTLFISATILSVAHITSAHLTIRAKLADMLPPALTAASLFSLLGMGWWLGAAALEFSHWIPDGQDLIMVFLAYFAVSAFIADILTARFDMPLLDKPIAFVLHAIIVAAMIQIAGTDYLYHPSQHYGYIGFTLAFAAHYAWLWRNRLSSRPEIHVASFIAAILLAGFELGYWLQLLEAAQSYKIAGWLLSAAAGLLLLFSLPQHRQFWFINAITPEIKRAACIALSVWLFALCMFSYTFQLPLNYFQLKVFPVMNVIELSEIAAVAALFAFCYYSQRENTAWRFSSHLLAVSAFGLINAVMLRIASVYLQQIYLSPYMWRKPEIATALTILWTLTAMGSMVLSSRKGLREGWLAGAGLLCAVVIKLFAIDLANIGTLSRILSFIGVGFLCLLLGYFSPMPPKTKQQAL